MRPQQPIQRSFQRLWLATAAFTVIQPTTAKGQKSTRRAEEHWCTCTYVYGEYKCDLEEQAMGWAAAAVQYINTFVAALVDSLSAKLRVRSCPIVVHVLCTQSCTRFMRSSRICCGYFLCLINWLHWNRWCLVTCVYGCLLCRTCQCRHDQCSCLQQCSSCLLAWQYCCAQQPLALRWPLAWAIGCKIGNARFNVE